MHYERNVIFLFCDRDINRGGGGIKAITSIEHLLCIKHCAKHYNNSCLIQSLLQFYFILMLQMKKLNVSEIHLFLALMLEGCKAETRAAKSVKVI